MTTTDGWLGILDVSGVMHRYFHAVSPRYRKADDLPTNAIYGLCEVLPRLLREGASHVAAVFDAPRTWRHEASSEYKSRRPKKPDDLKKQFDLALVACRLFGANPVLMEGFEADDIIAGLAHTYPGRVVIWSNDNDLYQCITRDGRVTMFDFWHKDGPRHIGVDEAQAHFHGLELEQIVDCKSLAGDYGDCVEGIPRVGLKTAAKLLHQYGTLAGVIANRQSIRGVVGTNVRDNFQKALAAKKLIKLDVAVPDLPAPWDIKYRPRDNDAIADYLTDMEFPNLARRYRTEEAA